MELVCISERLRREVAQLKFAEPVTHVYNPTDYAWETHRAYLERYGNPPKEVLLVGMNPGPFGMAQTGVPFGEVTMVRDWLGIAGAVQRPENEHPKRPVRGFDCHRSEVSGARLWGWARDRFGTPERFFARFFVWNYCPLCFMEVSGCNRTPDKLPANERAQLYKACDTALRSVVETLRPRYVIGVGKFAEDRARQSLPDTAAIIARIPHPSPANPNANRNWAKSADRAFSAIGIRL